MDTREKIQQQELTTMKRSSNSFFVSLGCSCCKILREKKKLKVIIFFVFLFYLITFRRILYIIEINKKERKKKVEYIFRILEILATQNFITNINNTNIQTNKKDSLSLSLTHL